MTAIADARKAVELDPAFWVGWMDLGCCSRFAANTTTPWTVPNERWPRRPGHPTVSG